MSHLNEKPARCEVLMDSWDTRSQDRFVTEQEDSGWVLVNISTCYHWQGNDWIYGS